MDGDDLFFLGRNNPAFIFKATHYPVNRAIKIVHLHRIFIVSCGDKGGFIADIGNVGA